MNRFVFFIFMISVTSNSFGQFDSNIKFKPIPPANTKPKVKEDLPPPSDFPKLNIPKIVAPNVLKETNIFGTIPKSNTAFEFGKTDNPFSMTLKNKFAHKMGDVYQDKMTKDLDKTMIREGLKEDKSFLDRTDRYLGEFKTKSDFLLINYRDYIQIDGDLITIYFST